MQDTSKTPSATGIEQLRKLPLDSLLPIVYGITGHKLYETYMQKNKAVVERQLQMGGALLVGCLEQLFSQITEVPSGALPPTDQ